MSQVNETYVKMLLMLATGIDCKGKLSDAIDDVELTFNKEELYAFSRDVNYILLEKVESLPYQKIAGIERLQGLLMYGTPYRWFTEVSGLGLAEQAKRLTQPDTPKRGGPVRSVRQLGR